MAQRQHLRDDRFHFIRTLLAFARRADCADKTRLGRSFERHRDGGVSCDVGIVHFSHVYYLRSSPERFDLIVFGTLAILFFLLAIGDFTNASPGFKHFTGYEGIFCGFSAIYTGLAQVLNELYDRAVLPLGPVSK